MSESAMSEQAAQGVNAESAIYAALQEFVYEVAIAPGLVGICMELDSGESASLGESLEELFGDEQALTVREILLASFGQDQDALSMVWADLHLLIYRIGDNASLWAWCDSARGEDILRDTWKKRRSAWASRLSSQGPYQTTPSANESAGWRADLAPKINALLRSTEALFVALRAAEVDGGPTQAHQEFASLAEEWASFCDPSLVSVPMLLDSLRQCLSEEGESRSEFFERMQELMAESLT